MHEPSPPTPRPSLGKFVEFSIGGIFILVLMAVLTIGKAFFLPVLLALLLSLTFTPIVRWSRKRGVPEVVSAVLIVATITIAIALGVSLLSEPLSNWLYRFPFLLDQLKDKFEFLRVPFNNFMNASSEMTNATASGDEEQVQRVIVEDQQLIVAAARNMLSVITTSFITIVLTFFLLAKGRVFYHKVVQSFSSLHDKKEALGTVYTIERSISRYLLAITIINICLGIAIGTALFLLGMPNPIIWGVVAALLNYLPYIGALMGIAGSTIVAILAFPLLSQALLIPAVYACLTILEGQFITPSVVGRQLSINPVIVFLSVAMWSWMWGLAGALIAVPLLVVIKAVSQQVEELHWLNFFMSDYEDTSAEEAEKEPTAVSK